MQLKDIVNHLRKIEGCGFCCHVQKNICSVTIPFKCGFDPIKKLEKLTPDIGTILEKL